MIKFISLIILFIFLVVFVTQTSTIKFTSPIGKNALQNTNTKIITNSNLTEFMKPGLNPVRNTYHNVLNGYLKNSYQINKDIIDFTESILPGIPSYSDIGYGAAVGAGLYGFYKDWKNDK
ncbi:hypothetical protein [Campylobacter concisus]|uniref:hypothetical protein n=1 Tax=Campylobacter concisus TaxID=199 RepID=UPI000CD87056|nr:hypothetical protein [Campylobacter concisus]